MNRHSPDTLRAGMARAHDEAGGMFELHVVNQMNTADLLAAAILGDAHAAALLRAVAQAARQIDRAPRRKPSLCLSCPRTIRRACEATFVVAVPHADEPTTAIGAALCPRCAASGDLTATALAGFRRHLWPDARPVRVTHPEGARA